MPKCPLAKASVHELPPCRELIIVTFTDIALTIVDGSRELEGLLIRRQVHHLLCSQMAVLGRESRHVIRSKIIIGDGSTV